MTVSRRDQAVQLRLAGLSRSQIAEALGLAAGGGEPLTTWLRDVPAPAWTRRPRAKDDLRETAVAMRKEGRSYREIREVVGVSKGTLSLWLREVELTEEQRRALALRSPVAGVVAYWAEGSKNKPWRTGQSVKFMNSDPRLIQFFLAWLRLVGVTSDRLIFRLHIHQSANATDAVAYWSNVVDAPVSQFGKTTVKSHNPKTVRKNVGAGYHGCLVVYVRNSAALNLQIEGWFEGLSAAAQAFVAG